jgi:hypothetical protein
MQVKVESFQLRDVQDATDWLNQRWSVKDTWLAGQQKNSSNE